MHRQRVYAQSVFHSETHSSAAVAVAPAWICLPKLAASNQRAAGSAAEAAAAT
jgi:hypothetical protein